jgi:hypothetical protein
MLGKPALTQQKRTHAPKSPARIDDLEVSPAPLLQQLPGVVSVETLVNATKPTHRIIHLRDFHHVPRDLYAVDCILTDEAEAAVPLKAYAASTDKGCRPRRCVAMPRALPDIMSRTGRPLGVLQEAYLLFRRWNGPCHA